MADDEFELNGISGVLFQRWKHDPVTKVFMRFLMDYERQLAEKQIALLRTATATPDAFTLGTFNGQINSVGMITELSFADMVEFYGTEEEDTDAA
jgi:hypothetical protein